MFHPHLGSCFCLTPWQQVRAGHEAETPGRRLLAVQGLGAGPVAGPETWSSSASLAATALHQVSFLYLKDHFMVEMCSPVYNQRLRVEKLNHHIKRIGRGYSGTKKAMME